MVIDCASEEITEESKVLLQRIIDNIDSPIYWKDKQGRYLGCNKAIVKLHQKEKIEDIIGCTDLELFDAKTAKQLMDNDRKVWSNNEILNIEEDISRFCGKYTVHLSKKSPLLDQQGNICGVIGTSVDISQRKLLEQDLSRAYETAQQNFQQIIDSLDTNVYWKDKEGRYLGCNRSVVKLAGRNSIEEIVGHTDYDLSDRNIAEVLRSNDSKAMFSIEGLVTQEKFIVPSGEERYYAVRKSPLLDKKGDIRGIIGVSIDITERKKLEEETKRQKEELEEKDRLKRLFVKNFSHDAKVPFESIVGATQLLMILSKKYPEFNKTVTKIDNGVMAINKILNQMCTAIMNDQFGEKVYSKEFDFSKMIEEEIELAKTSIKLGQVIEITVDIEKRIPKIIYGDELKVNQILRNLLCNAIKYSKTGETGQIKLAVNRVDAPKSKTKIKFTVSDTGIGIAEKDKDKIYEYGRRLVKSYTDNIPGIGLGLHMVKNHVDVLGGTIDCHSELGKGTRFDVELTFDDVKNET